MFVSFSSCSIIPRMSVLIDVVLYLYNKPLFLIILPC